MSKTSGVPEQLYNGPLVLWMEKMKDKTTLNLSDRNLTARDVEAIGYVLKTNNTLTKLYLDNNNITDVKSIGEALKTNKTLEVLDLYNNQLSDNMKSQLQAIEQYKKVKIYIGRYSNKIKLRF